MMDRLVHEPARLRLVTLLYVVNEADFVHLADQTDLTDGNISSCMPKLEDAGYVEIGKTFAARKPRTVYRLTPAGHTPPSSTEPRLTRCCRCSTRGSRLPKPPQKLANPLIQEPGSEQAQNSAKKSSQELLVK